MRLTDAHGQLYKAHFYYDGDGRRTTHCRLHREQCDRTPAICTKPSTIGVAVCSRQDEFTKATGRKIALSRAMFGIERSTRGQLWADYLIQCPPSS